MTSRDRSTILRLVQELGNLIKAAEPQTITRECQLDDTRRAYVQIQGGENPSTVLLALRRKFNPGTPERNKLDQILDAIGDYNGN